MMCSNIVQRLYPAMWRASSAPITHKHVLSKCYGVHVGNPGVLPVTRQLVLIVAARGRSVEDRNIPAHGAAYSTVSFLNKNKNFLKVPRTVLTSERSFNKKKTVKILPTKPLHFDYSGDIKTDLDPVDLSQPRLEYAGTEEYESADEIVKKVLSLEFGTGQDLLKQRVHNVLERVKDHPTDLKSLEVSIANKTVRIRNQMKHVLACRKDKSAKSYLIERIQSRRKMLKNLRKLDFAKFEWLLEELELKYTPVPEYNRKLSKRATRKKVARDAAFAIRNQKMELFRQKLAEEKQVFLEYKEKEMAKIEDELGQLDLGTDSHLSKVFMALKDGTPLPEKRQPTLNRRQLILQKKFALYCKKDTELAQQ